MKPTLRILLLIAVATVLGTVWAGVKGVPWAPDVDAVRTRLANQKANAQRVAEAPQVDDTELDRLAISLEELRRYIADGAAIIDARDRAAFEAEHLFVDREPPVINVPPEDAYDAHLDRLYSLQGYPIVLYCNSAECELAEDLYRFLVSAGITESSEVRIFRPGWAVLEHTDLPKASGPDTWTGFGSPPADPFADTDEPASNDEGSQP
ncbi:MAG: rhodanese-like domain-containing protein [Planctomycetota bacterium]|nr:MAG: rhodanese-like domain-containing protein [Planctomycetota bacterium]